MSKSIWKINEHQAQLNLPGLQGILDLNHPEMGLHQVHFQNQSWPEAVFWGIRMKDGSSLPLPLEEFYLREQGIVATYAETTENPFRLQLHWSSHAEHNLGPQIDLLVSVQTSSLEWLPQLTIESSLPGQQSEKIITLAKEEQKSSLPQEFGMFTQAPTSTWGYCELFDDNSVETNGSWETAAEWQSAKRSSRITHQLTRHPMEKGVILRTRLRGLFLPSIPKREQLEQAAKDFQREPVPLGI